MGKPKLSEDIYISIKDDIVNKVFLPGEKINVKELARKYNVSDTPVKQALLRLMSDNVIVNEPNKGMVVRTFTLSEMRDLFEIRLMMDLFFMKDFIYTLNHNKILSGKLMENVDLHLQFTSTKASDINHENYYSIDLAFHTLYFISCGNKKAVQVFHNLNPFVYAQFNYIQQSSTRNIECANEHKEILNTALAGDIEGLEHAIRLHNKNSMKNIENIFQIFGMQDYESALLNTTE